VGRGGKVRGREATGACTQYERERYPAYVANAIHVALLLSKHLPAVESPRRPALYSRASLSVREASGATARRASSA
jgi:hypothetical protein